MKMIIAIVGDDDTDHVIKCLTSAELPVTTIASNRGFLRKGQSTMLIGVEDRSSGKCSICIRSCFPAQSTELRSRCTIFVINVNQGMTSKLNRPSRGGFVMYWLRNSSDMIDATPRTFAHRIRSTFPFSDINAKEHASLRQLPPYLVEEMWHAQTSP